jgi:uncharacterized protein (TIGR03118 family)
MILDWVVNSLTSRLRPASPRRRNAAVRRQFKCRLSLQPLDDRCLPSGYVQTNLASDIPGEALVYDPELVDAWGLALNEGPAATFWVSSRATGLSTVYVGDRPGVPFAKSTLTVTVPGGEPTGQVFSGSADFVVTSGTQSGPSRFITVSNTGHLTGWNPNVPSPPAPARTAHMTATTPGAIYTGLAIGNNGAGNFLYAADFNNGEIDVFDRTFTPTTLAGSFTDPGMRSDYAPFNIQRLAGKLYVTYAQKHDDGIPHGGNGFVSVFDMNGNFLKRLVSEGGLSAPWGLALAPATFGEFSNALLVGNFNSGHIRAYNPTSGAFLGELRDSRGDRIDIDGLWGLSFGNANTGDPNALYFTAGTDNQRHGLLGRLRVASSGSSFAASSTTGEGVSGSGSGPISGTVFATIMPDSLGGLVVTSSRSLAPRPAVLPNPAGMAPALSLHPDDAAGAPIDASIAEQSHTVGSPIVLGLVDGL